MMTAVNNPATRATRIRHGHLGRVGDGLAVLRDEVGDRRGEVEFTGGGQPEELGDRPHGLAHLCRDGRQVTDEGDGGVQQRDGRAEQHAERHEGTDDVGDGHGQSPGLERHVAGQPVDRRLEDVGQQPADEQDDGRAREGGDDARRQVRDDRHQGDHRQPEQQPDLAP